MQKSQILRINNKEYDIQGIEEVPETQDEDMANLLDTTMDVMSNDENRRRAHRTLDFENRGDIINEEVVKMAQQNNLSPRGSQIFDKTTKVQLGRPKKSNKKDIKMTPQIFPIFDTLMEYKGYEVPKGL